MASPFSQIQRASLNTDPFNLDLYKEVRMREQAAFEQNEQMLNQTVSQIAGIDLLRDKDREYLNSRLKGVVEMINNTDGIDFSSGVNGRRLANYISSSIDENIIKQASNTKRYRNFNAQIEDLKKKNPEQYNELNHQDALVRANVMQYFNGQTDDLGNLNYNPYVNVEEAMFKRAKTMKDIMPDQKMKVMMDNGMIVEKKVSAMNQAEWTTALLNGMTSQEKNQLAIEARASYGYDDQAAAADYDARYSALEQNFDDAIQELQLRSSGATGNKKRQLDQAIAQYKAMKQSQLAKLDVSSKDAGTIGATFRMLELSEGLARGLAVDTITDYDYSHLNYLAKLRGLNLQEKRLQFDVMKEQRRAAEKQAELNAASQDAGVGGSRAFSVMDPVKTDEDLESFQSQYGEYHDNTIKAANQKLGEVYNKLKNQLLEDGTSKADAIDKIKANYIGENPGATESEINAAVSTIALNMNLLNASDARDVRSSINDIKRLETHTTQANRKAADQVMVNAGSKIFDEITGVGFFDRPETDIPYYNKDGEKSTMLEQINTLKSQGINTAEEFRGWLASDSQKAKEFKANMALQAASKKKLSANVVPMGTTPGIIPSRMVDPDYSTAYGGYASDFFGVNLYNTLHDEVLAENEVAPIGIRDTNIIPEEGDMMREFDLVSFRRLEAEFLGKDQAFITSMNRIAVPAGTIEKGRGTDPLHRELMQLTSYQNNFDPKRGFEMRVDGSNIVLTQSSSTAQSTVDADGESISQKNKVQTAVIPMDVAMQNPYLSRYMQDVQNVGKVNFMVDGEVSVTPLYAGTSAYQQAGLDQLFGNDFEKIAKASPDDAINYILASNKEGIQRNPQTFQQISQFVEDAVSQSDKFQIELREIDGRGYVSIGMRTPTGDIVNLHSIRNIDTESQEFQDIYNGAPQVILTDFLNLVVNDYYTSTKPRYIQAISENLE